MDKQTQWGLAGLTLCLASCAVQAQSSVTISGYLDMGVYRGFDKITRVGPMGRDNLAFSGTEDLGGGLSAVFRLSTRFEMDTGQVENPSAFWHDEATVGLKSTTLGTLRVGRGLTALWSYDWQFDPWYNYNRVASPAWQFWHYLTPSDRVAASGGPEYGRLNNGIFYDSPTFGGVSVHLSGTPEATTGPGGGRNSSGALTWSEGTAGAMVAGERNGSGDTVWFAAGRYGFGNATVYLAYDVSKMATTVPMKARAITASGTYVIGATTLKLGLGKQDLNGTDTRFYSLGADYALSRRTTLYASLGHYSPQPVNTSTAFGVGLAHAF